MHLILNVKNINAFVDFEVSMKEGTINDVYRLDQEGSRWFYGKKALNNKCSINLHLNEKSYIYE